MAQPAEAPSACALCGGTGRTLHEGLGDRLFESPGTWDLVACSACSLVWLDPPPAPDAVGAFYDSYYTHEDAEESLLERALYRGIATARMGYPEAPGTGAIERLLSRALAWVGPLREIAEHAVMWLPVSRRGRLLDVGCGSGAFLQRMGDFGWEVAGVEPDPEARLRASSRLGGGVVAADLDTPALEPGSFDAITMSHVIEHVADPGATLRRCNELLAPGGLLVCVTPNSASLGARSFGSAWLHWDPPRHLQLFDREALERAVREAGLEVRHGATPGSTAHFVWQASALIERNGRLPGARVTRVSPSLLLESVGFWLLEYVLTGLGRNVGEEVLVVAEKPGS